MDHPRLLNVVHRGALSKIRCQRVGDPNSYCTVCFFVIFLARGEATSRLGGRRRGWDGVGDLHRGTASVAGTASAGWEPVRAALQSRLPSPQLPCSHFPTTLGRPGAGAGVRGAGEPPPPAASAAPDVPGASSSVCSSSLPRRGGINDSREMNNLSKVKGKGRLHLRAWVKVLMRETGQILGQSRVPADLHRHSRGLGDASLRPHRCRADPRGLGALGWVSTGPWQGGGSPWFRSTAQEGEDEMV